MQRMLNQQKSKEKPLLLK